MKTKANNIAETLLDLERSLNERWSTGDSSGYLDNYHEDITYFDPVVETLLVGSREQLVAVLDEALLGLRPRPQVSSSSRVLAAS